MLLRYFYNDKLAHASYLLGCQAAGEAIVVDPGRDVEPYLCLAEAQGMRIAGVTETHIHADFVSGARELAERTGATLYLSKEVLVIDVRGQAEWDEGHLPGAVHAMLGYLPERAAEFPPDKLVVVHCLTGGRSAIAASILQAQGIPTVINMVGGMRDWAAGGLPVERNKAAG